MTGKIKFEEGDRNMNIIEAAKELEPHLQELRRAFHRCPEISGHEVRTAERIEK